MARSVGMTAVCGRASGKASFCKLYMRTSVEGLLQVGCGCRSHRNRRHIAEAQVAGSNVVSGAGSCEGRLTFASLNATHP